MYDLKNIYKNEIFTITITITVCTHVCTYMCTHVYVFIMYTCRTRVHNGYILNQLDRLEFDFFDHTT